MIQNTTELAGPREHVAKLGEPPAPGGAGDDARHAGRDLSAGRHHAQNVQYLGLSHDEVAGTCGGTYAAITCVVAKSATFVVSVAGDDDNVTVANLANM